MTGMPYKHAIKQIRGMKKAIPAKEFRVGRLDGLYTPQIFVDGVWQNIRKEAKTDATYEDDTI